MTEVAIGIGAILATATGTLRMGADPAPVGMIEQRFAAVTTGAYLIVGGQAERRPLLAALSTTYASTDGLPT